MTVSSTNTKNSYNGDGSTTVFAYTFKIFDDDDIIVILRTDATGGETVQTKGTHYSVSGVGDAGGGNITFVTAPASGITVVLIRATVQTQTTDYTPNDPFPAASHEDALDRLTLMVQDQQEELDRAIKVSRTNTISTSEFTIGPSDRANKVFAFDANGDFSVTQEIGTYKGTDTTTTTSAYSARDIVKSTTAAQLGNVYIATQNSPAGTLLTNTTYWQLLIDAVAAATSAAAAASSATDAETAQTAAEAAQAAAETAQANAETAETNAETAETNAETAQAAAEAAQAAAETAETNAATSETNAATSASASATSATASASSATAAASSATAAAASESAAATSETNAATSASNAATSETNAATSESNASTSASNAATSASNASTSETNAASSATAAAASQVAAAASAASAASAFDNFDDTYLGAKASDPTVDNDGDPLTQGDLYFNTTANEMRVYDGGSWIAASSAGGASLLMYEYTATSGQTTFSGSDDNANTLSYTIDNIIVTLNGVVLDPDDYTATSGTSIVLGTGAALNDELNVVAFKSFTTADMVSATNGGTFGNDITVTGTVTADGLTVQNTAASNAQIVIENTSAATSTDYKIVAGKVGVSNEGFSIYDSANATTAYYIDSTGNHEFLGGNVGIGTSSPSTTFHVNSGTVNSTALFQSEDSVASIYLIDSNTTGGVSASHGMLTTGDELTIRGIDHIAFDTGTTERMRIDSSGKVIITKTAVAGSQTASVTGSTTLDFGTYQNFILTLTGNITLANPTTEQVGQSGFITFIQTGGYTVSLGTDYETAGGAGITLSASGTDVVPYIVAASGRILLGAPQLAFA